MTRRALYLLGLLIAGGVAAALGAMSALTWTGPGHALLARVVSQESGRLIRGRMTVAGLSGNFISQVGFTDLEVRDTTGALLIAVPAGQVNFRLLSLLRGRLVFDAVRLERPRIAGSTRGVSSRATSRASAGPLQSTWIISGATKAWAAMLNRVMYRVRISRLRMPWVTGPSR